MAPETTSSNARLAKVLKRALGLALCVALCAGAWAVYTEAIEIPERWNPWAPLDTAVPPDWLTGFKLARARSEPARCRAALARTGMRYEPLPDRTTGEGCGFDNAVRLRDAGVRLSPAAPALSCPVALSFLMWERHALQPAAMRRFGQRVATVEHLGSYACRNVNRGEGATPGAARSRHATANALDVAGLVLADGRRITVSRDWPHAGAADAKDAKDAKDADDSDHAPGLLLRDAHDGACRFFDGVLGPEYNAVHRDHFHLETGGYRMCR